MIFYKLNGKEIVGLDNVIEWEQWFKTADRKVGMDKIGDKSISTVFLGLDHSFYLELDNQKPILFETMVFPDFS